MPSFRAALIVALGGADTRKNPCKYTRMEMSRERSLNLTTRMMAAADTNKDGLLQFEEFEAFFWDIRTSDAAAANLAFALFDRDSDDSINEHEFRELYRLFLGHLPKEKEFQNEWALLDPLGDQEVN